MLFRSAQDTGFKKPLYEQLGVKEYWLFDPRGEWIKEKLRGYRLRGESYELITNSISEALELRLEVEDKLIGFYREDTGEKLLIPEELWSALQTEIQRRIEAVEMAEQQRQRAEQAQQIAQQERQRAEQLVAQLRALGIEPET